MHMLVIPRSGEPDNLPKSLCFGIFPSSLPTPLLRKSPPPGDYFSNINQRIQSPLPPTHWAVSLQTTTHLPKWPPRPSRRQLGTAPLPQSPLKLFELANPKPAYLPHLFLPEQATIKTLAHNSSLSLCLSTYLALRACRRVLPWRGPPPPLGKGE